MRPYGYIYIDTCIINGKFYVGQTIKTPEKRKEQHIREAFRGSPDKYHRALVEFGPKNFKLDILDFAESEEELDKKESYWVDRLSAIRQGFNMIPGGTNPPDCTGMKRTNEQREKISQALKGKPKSQEQREKQSKAMRGRFCGENNPNFGKHMLEESKILYGIPNVGKHRSPEHKKILSERNRGNTNNAKLNYEKAGEIRLKYIPRKYSCYKLAKEYNVSPRTVNLIILNKIWIGKNA